MSNQGSNQINANPYNEYLASYGVNECFVTNVNSSQTLLVGTAQVVLFDTIANTIGATTYCSLTTPNGTILIGERGMYSFSASIPIFDNSGSGQIVACSIELLLANRNGPSVIGYSSSYNPTSSAAILNYSASATVFCDAGDSLQVLMLALGPNNNVIPRLSGVPYQSRLVIQKVA